MIELSNEFSKQKKYTFQNHHIKYTQFSQDNNNIKQQKQHITSCILIQKYFQKLLKVCIPETIEVSHA